jgi:hypothetical protein
LLHFIIYVFLRNNGLVEVENQSFILIFLWQDCWGFAFSIFLFLKQTLKCRAVSMEQAVTFYKFSPSFCLIVESMLIPLVSPVETTRLPPRHLHRSSLAPILANSQRPPMKVVICF